MEKKDFILEIYKDKRTVFGVSDVVILFPQEENKYLSDRMSGHGPADAIHLSHERKAVGPLSGEGRSLAISPTRERICRFRILFSS